MLYKSDIKQEVGGLPAGVMGDGLGGGVKMGDNKENGGKGKRKGGQ